MKKIMILLGLVAVGPIACTAKKYEDETQTQNIQAAPVQPVKNADPNSARKEESKSSEDADSQELQNALSDLEELKRKLAEKERSNTLSAKEQAEFDRDKARLDLERYKAEEENKREIMTAAINAGLMGQMFATMSSITNPHGKIEDPCAPGAVGTTGASGVFSIFDAAANRGMMPSSYRIPPTEMPENAVPAAAEVPAEPDSPVVAGDQEDTDAEPLVSDGSEEERLKAFLEKIGGFFNLPAEAPTDASRPESDSRVDASDSEENDA